MKRTTQHYTGLKTGLSFFCLWLMLVGEVQAKKSLEEVASHKMAYISVNEAVERTGEQKRIRKILEADKNKIQQNIQNRSKKFREEVEEIKKGMAILSEEEKMKKYEEIQQMQMRIEQFAREQEMKFQKKETELRKTVMKKIQKAAALVAAEEKVDLIKNRDSLIWVNPKMDLTAQVVRAYKKIKGK